MKLSTYWDKQLFHHLFAICLIAGQAGILDYYLVSFNVAAAANELPNNTVHGIHHNRNLLQHGGYGWLGWVAADVVVLAVVIISYFIGRRYIERQLAACHVEDGQGCKRLPHMGILPYAWLQWAVYSVVFVGKIIAIFKTFGTSLLETDHLGINTLEFTFGASAAVFMLFVGGLEHLATNAQKHYIRWMQHYVLLEIVDCVEFLTSLFVAAEVGKEEEKRALPHAMQDVILAFACINLLAPAHALYRLSSFHNRHPETRNRFFLTQTLVGTLFGNIPYFIVRIMLWQQHSYITGLFAMKNLIGIFTDSQELVEFFHEYRQNKGEESSDDESEPEMKNVGNKYTVGSAGERMALGAYKRPDAHISA